MLRRLSFLFIVGLAGSALGPQEPQGRATKPGQSAQHTAVIFDLGEVIFTSKRPGYVHQILERLLVRQRLFDFLHEASHGMRPHDPSMADHFPTIIGNWLTGGLSGHEAKLHIALHLKKKRYSSFTSRIWLALCHHVFDPHTLAKSMSVKPETVALIRALKDQGYKLYVLSNWDHVSFPLMLEKHDELFALFDGIMISGHEKIGKPNTKIYKRLLSRYGLDASECVFIDDMEHNVEAAKAVGIHGLCLSSHSQLVEDLEAVGIFVSAERNKFQQLSLKNGEHCYTA